VCCEDHAATEMRQYAKRRTKDLNIAGQGGVRVNTAGCLDRCSEGPVVVVYPDAVWYTYENRDDIEEIVEEHLVNGRIVERLRI
jgi:(2Fe-2S) ferredoxin